MQAGTRGRRMRSSSSAFTPAPQPRPGLRRTRAGRQAEVEASQSRCDISRRIEGATGEHGRCCCVPPEIPDIHPNIAGIYRRKVARLAEALRKPEERDAVASAIRGLIERIVLTPGASRGDLGTILEWTGNAVEKEKTDTPSSGMSVSVVAGARHHRYQQGLFQAWA